MRTDPNTPPRGWAPLIVVYALALAAALALIGWALDVPHGH